ALDRSEEGVWIIPPFAEQPVEPVPQKVGTGSGGAGVTDHDEVAGDDALTVTDRGQVVAKTKAVKCVSIAGTVPLESWTEVFRCFVGPAARLGLKPLELGIAFKLVAQDSQPLDPDHPTIKAMREAARQLGIEIVEDSGS